MRVSLILFFVCLALAALAFSLASDWWDKHPVYQVLWISSGAIGTTLSPLATRQIYKCKSTANAGNYLILIVAFDFVMRMLVSPVLLWSAMQLEEDSPLQGAMTFAFWIKRTLLNWVPLLLMVLAAFRGPSLLWRVEMGVLFCSWLAWELYKMSWYLEFTPGDHLGVVAAIVTTLAFISVLATSILDTCLGMYKQRTPLHWTGVTLYAVLLALSSLAEWWIISPP